MAGPGLFDNLSFSFGASDPKSYDAMRLRQQIATALLSQKKGYPKTVGEGLTSIGDAIGDVSMMNRLEGVQARRDEAAAQKAAAISAQPDPSAATPGSTDPSTGRRSEVEPPVQTADASYFPDPSTAQPSIPASMVPQLGQSSPGPINPAQTSQLSMLLGKANPTASPYAPTASLDQPPILANDAIRNAVAPSPPLGGLPQNPMLAGSVPQSLGASPALRLGSAPDSVSPIPMPGVRLAEAGTKPAPALPTLPPVSRMPPAVKLPGEPGEPIEPAPMETRPAEAPFIAPRPEKPPRIADPGNKELQYMRAANDPNFSPTEQAHFKELAGEFEARRKADLDQAVKAYETRNRLFEADQERRSRSPEIELNRQALEDARQQRQRTEKIARVFGPSGIAPAEKGVDESYKNVQGLAQQNRAINQIRTALTDEKMFTGSAAELNTTRAKVLHAFGFRLDPRVADTERFATLMAPIVAANRRMISGNQNISDKDVESAMKASGGDPRLEKESLMTILDDLQEGSIATATEHQRKIRDLTGALGEKDYEARMYNQRGVPNMDQMVRDEDVQRLIQNASDPKMHKMFDEAYHTPGLSLRVLSTRR